MNLLVIGGSVFVGRTIVETALASGHEVTMFNRGQQNPDLFPTVEKIRGDRDGEMDKLAGRQWDAVIDTCGYVPRVVRQSVEALKESVPHYTFISSISAYAESKGAPLDEDSPLANMNDEGVEEITGDTYGPLKVLCEQVVQAAYGDGALIIRPGLIVGPRDRTDRFTYWPVRIADGGPVLVPSRLDQPSQFIDVRDLAEWTVRMVEQKANGVYNATGPETPYTFGHVLERCKAVSGSSAHLVPVNGWLLEEHKVEPWADLPLVLPLDGSGDSMGRAVVSRAVEKGLTFRPLDTTIKDTLQWFRTERPEAPLKAGMSREKEAQVLAAVSTAR
jgi:2'-hydroxyisoflavone reductase